MESLSAGGSSPHFCSPMSFARSEKYLAIDCQPPAPWIHDLQRNTAEPNQRPNAAIRRRSRHGAPRRGSTYRLWLGNRPTGPLVVVGCRRRRRTGPATREGRSLFARAVVCLPWRSCRVPTELGQRDGVGISGPCSSIPATLRTPSRARQNPFCARRAMSTSVCFRPTGAGLPIPPTSRATMK